MSQITICLVIFVAMLVLFFTNKIPMSFTALGAMIALVLTGCLEGSSAIAIFGILDVDSPRERHQGYGQGQCLDTEVGRSSDVELGRTLLSVARLCRNDSVVFPRSDACDDVLAFTVGGCRVAESSIPLLKGYLYTLMAQGSFQLCNTSYRGIGVVKGDGTYR